MELDYPTPSISLMDLLVADGNDYQDLVDNLLKEIMQKIHSTCVDFGSQKGFVNYVNGANIGGFVRIADSMVDQGVI